jgi:DNA-binding transcriptional regulator YiaG
MTPHLIIKKLRLALSLEQAEFGKEFDVTAGTVSNWESGRRVPRLSKVRLMLALAKKHKIKLSIEDFLT